MLKASLAASLLAAAASAETVFLAEANNGFFAPFTPFNTANLIYGDSGWLTGPGEAPVGLGRMTLKLAVYNAPLAGTTDIVFTFNDGDPSGLVFGPGTELFQTTVFSVALPPTEPFGSAFLEVDIELPNVMTKGNFNNIGWSVRLENYAYEGDFGFQVSNCEGQLVGYYTNNASWSQNAGANWGLFAFGQDPCLEVANYAVTIERYVCRGDLDDSGTVDAGDIGSLLLLFGDCPDGVPGCPGDLDGSGTVDAGDIGSLLLLFGPCG
jgi:hypothetical protein